MAQRYGGKFSPDGESEDLSVQAEDSQYTRAKVDPVGARANLLFIPAVIMVFMSVLFGGGAVGMSR